MSLATHLHFVGVVNGHQIVIRTESFNFCDQKVPLHTSYIPQARIPVTYVIPLLNYGVTVENRTKNWLSIEVPLSSHCLPKVIKVTKHHSTI